MSTHNAETLIRRGLAYFTPDAITEPEQLDRKSVV